ncbi:hypothetical protein [Pararhodospirillum photometricum]|uniref:hypothetical protein n=1 Tax=Pararhodospirillum photometricum TaxID=1084 RepID=UPI0002E21A0B|nr:hypothetical protein [Pararhodospirillum photometricum]
MRLEKDEYTNKPRPLHDFTTIHFTCGMTPNKKQLMHLVVAPKHLGNPRDATTLNDWLFSSECLKDGVANFDRNISPIYFSHLLDPLNLYLLQSGMARQRSNATVAPTMSDFPSIYLPFVREVYLRSSESEGFSKALLLDTVNTKKGIRALSQALRDIYKDRTQPLSVYIDPSRAPQEENFMRSQNYTQMGQGEIDLTPILRSMTILAGHPKYMKFANTANEADVTLSFTPQDGDIAIPIYRFIPVITKDTSTWTKMKRSEEDDAIFLTVGGPEHNKLLEMFIALHRWGSGQTVMSQSNHFDMQDWEGIDSAVMLHTEAYVGGIMRRLRQDEAENNVERKRSGDGAFLINFTAPLDILDPAFPQENPELRGKSIKVVAVIGMSARGSVTGLTYVAYNTRYNFEANSANILDLPGYQTTAENNVGSTFPIDYIRRILKGEKIGTADWDKPLLAETIEDEPKEIIARLATRLNSSVFNLLGQEKLHFPELARGDTHAMLMTLIAERFFIKKP